MSNYLCKTLAVATIERQVEDAYNYALERAFPGIKFKYPFACDGYCEFEVDGKTHRLLIEYKYDEAIMSIEAVRKALLEKKYENATMSLNENEYANAKLSDDEKLKRSKENLENDEFVECKYLGNSAFEEILF